MEKINFRAIAEKNMVGLSMAAALSCALAGPASATVPLYKVLSFSYAFTDGNVLSGSLSGTDSGNYFTVTGVTSLLVNGVSQAAYIPTATVDSNDAFDGAGSGHNNNNTPVVTVDGSYMDLIFTGDGITGVDFSVGDAYSVKQGFNYAAYSLAAGSDAANPYLQSSYHASLAVPETATWAMMLVGLGAIGFAMRRRATVTVTYA